MSSSLDIGGVVMMMGECVDKAASRKYRFRTLVVAAAYMALTYASVRWLHRQPALPWRYVIAILPVLPIFLMPALVIEYFRNLDELQKKIQLEALGFAFAATALSTLSYGFLQNAGLPDVNWVWVWPIMAVFWTIGLLAARWRYR
ncbi:MAG TPA: hypothetical protein VFA85_01230 [Terriglobales bacterium]|nr:hypothetical protein [Terriglobales bacterium]